MHFYGKFVMMGAILKDFPQWIPFYSRGLNKGDYALEGEDVEIFNSWGISWRTIDGDY